MNLNKAFIIGNLTRDPEMKTLPSGTPVVSFGVATNRVWKNQSGEKQQEVQFHNIVVFGRQAEVANQYLKKGSSALIEGRIQTSHWEAQDGTKRSKTEIVAERIQLGPRRNGQNSSSPTDFSKNANNSNPSSQKTESLDTIEYPEENNDPDNIPF
ncbi:single-stranded DNA-binding protein [Patescibacteria group bacterium]|nr:single-stranded DNA-binding protein [Patescibacteria group bacterium]MBU2633477.1 single-stranded DNA-binding protein [Patescibacteria group bacterium]